jgi:hypothetical protein
MKGNFLVRSSHIRDCLLILPRWNGRETIVDSSFLTIHGSHIISFISCLYLLRFVFSVEIDSPASTQSRAVS